MSDERHDYVVTPSPFMDGSIGSRIVFAARSKEHAAEQYLRTYGDRLDPKTLALYVTPYVEFVADKYPIAKVPPKPVKLAWRIV